MFTVYFGRNYFYPEVSKKWLPFVQRLKLPFMNIEDYMNCCIQSITFPEINLSNPSFQRGQFPTKYRTGSSMDALNNKTFTLTFKLTESYLSYWIMFDQLYYFLQYKDTKPIFMDPITLRFLNDQGFGMLEYIYIGITPSNLSNVTLSYPSQLAKFSSFTLQCEYNYFDLNKIF